MPDHRGIGLVGLGFLIGSATFFTLGYLGGRAQEPSSDVHESYDYSWAIDAVNRSNIREYLAHLSSEPHLAGLGRDEDLARWVESQWLKAGLDRVSVEGYRMLMDYPDKDNPNYVTVWDKEGEVIYKSHYKEEGVDDPNFVDAFNAYSRNGTAEGVPVYVNFGTVDDFKWLRDNFGEEVTKNQICLARYGKIYRGNKAEHAYQFGCSGLIIFMDPSTVAMEGTEQENLFPNTFWMPGTAVQRGSLSMVDGDPLTPTWPSMDHAYRLDEEDRSAFLPHIPVQPIGYTDAEQILNKMGGAVAPAAWQGGINITYRIGGVFVEGLEGGKITVEVNNKMEEKVSSNVIGVLYGAVEPDRYVMIENHRDAWGFGALDSTNHGGCEGSGGEKEVWLETKKNNDIS